MGRRKKQRAHAPLSQEGTAPFRSRAVFVGLASLAVLALLGGGWRLVARRPANLLFVTIDTLRADHVGAWGNAAAETPALDGLAARGVRCARAEAAAPLTGPSHATIFTGLYPPEHGVRDNVVFTLDASHVTLAALLKARGYRTAAFVAAYPVARDFGLGQGFDEYHEGFHETPIPGQGAERPGNEVADEAIAWLRAEHGPFFAWVHLYDPHAPYTPPSPYRERFAGRPYDGEIAFADAQLGRILQALDASGRRDDTLIVAMADHGESLGEHDEQTHAILVYESTLHIPLIFAGRGVPKGRVVEDRVSAVDVLPTVLGLLGLSAPDGARGRDLRAAFDGGRPAQEALYAESLFGRLNCRWSSLRALTVGDWKLVQGTRAELFDLASDPTESRDRSADEPQRVESLSGLLRAAVGRMAPAGDTARTAVISPEQAERLRSLGYTSGSGGAGALDEPGLPDPRTHVKLYERIQATTRVQGPGALAELVAISDQDPGNPYAQYSLGNMAYHMGRLRLAETAYARTMDLDPDRPSMRAMYGRLLRDVGRLQDAERQLRIAVGQTTEGDVRTRMALADTLVDLGQTKEAEALVDAALARSPGHVDALRSKGRLLVVTGRTAEGFALLEQAAHGADPEPWIEIARYRLDAKDAPAALAAADEAVARNPAHPWALAEKGQALIALGRRDEGLDWLRRALAASPRRPEAWLALAKGFASAGEKTTAERCRREAQAILRG